MPCVNGETFAEVVAGLDADDRGFTFLDTGTALSFTELARVTADLAARWAGLGVARGDRVVLISSDAHEFIVTILAALRAGVVAVPYFPPYLLAQRDAYAAGLRRVCATSGAALCLADARTAALLTADELPCPVREPGSLASAPPGATPVPTPADPAFIQFTSGSTGNPKGVVVPHAALVGHGRALAAALHIDGRVDRGVSWLPLFHDMGLIGKVFAAVHTQTPVWYTAPQRFVRDPVGFLRTVSRVGGSIVFAPNFAYGLWARKADPAALDGLDLSRWRIAGCGAEPVQHDTLARFAAAYAPAGFRAGQLVPCYGLAESTLAVCAARPGTGMTALTVDAERLAARQLAVPVPDGAHGAVTQVSSGRPLPGVRLRVLGPSGEPLPEDAEGEIAVRCGYLAAGYHGDPAATADTWRDGWLHTGDTGFVHAGELYVTGRIKDLIIVNGRNHQPHDIEQQVARVAGVRDGGVIAFGTRRGDSEAVHVLVEAVAYPPAADLAARVEVAVRQEFGVPVDGVTVVRRGTLPRTSSGKPRRRLAARLLADGGLAVAAVPRPRRDPAPVPHRSPR